MTSPAVSPWQVQMLGAFTARRGRQEVSRFRTRKMASLLAYLSCHKEQAHPREGVIERFWPDASPCAGRQSLSQALCALRHQLEGPGVERGAVIVADRLTVRLDPRAIQTDVGEFESALHEARNAADGTTARRLHLKSAHAFYQGEFLPGYYDDWVLTERARLSELHLGVLVELGLEHERAGERDRAIQMARSAIANEPWCEVQHRTLMRLLAESGHGAAALRHYRELVERLRVELDAKPEPQTQTLARAIQSGALHECAAKGARTGIDQLTVAPAAVPCLATGTVTFLLAAGGHATEATIAATAEHAGQIIRAESDAGVAVFARAADALAAALAVAGGGNAHGPTAVALHTGDLDHLPSPTEADDSERFQGTTLERAERFLHLGHPGQVLLSEPTARLLEADLSPELQLTDLGTHRLPAGKQPERLFQITERNRAASFPPLRTQRALAGQAPLQLTRFFGREAELNQIKMLLDKSSIRLLTLVGPGGTGKTRLALEAASQAAATAAPGGVYFVPLSDLTDPEHVPGAVLEAMQRPVERSAEPLAALVRALESGRIRLVLDNVEHLLPRAAQIVGELLAAAPGLSCLATSRRPLGVNGEWRFAVPPLAVPEGPTSLTELATFESVQLFVDRAQAVRPDFQVSESNAAALAKLCAHLDGNPLAIELAAARSQVLTPAQMLRRLERRLDFLATRRQDVPPRHRTLRATCEWSYRLLSPEVQRFLAELAVFRGGMSLDAVAAVSRNPLALDHLVELQELSLLQGEEVGGEMRFRLLDTIQEFAGEKLPADARPELEARHADYYVTLTEQARRGMNSAQQPLWLDRIALEHDNLRLIFDRSVAEGASPASVQLGLRLVGAISTFWATRGHLREGRQRIAELLRQPAAADRTLLRGLALLEAGSLALTHSAPPESLPLLEEALAIFRELDAEAQVGRALNHLANAAFSRGDFLNARDLYQEGLEICYRIKDRRSVSQALTNLGSVANSLGNYAEARARYTESLAIKREVGIPRDIVTALMGLGNVAENEGDFPASLAYHEECLELCRASGDRPRIGWTLVNIGNVVARMGDTTLARTHYLESLRIAIELGDRLNVSGCLDGLANLTFACGQAKRAAQLFGAATTLRITAGGALTLGDQAAHDAFEAEMRAALGENAMSQALAAGEALAQISLPELLAAGVIS